MLFDRISLVESYDALRVAEANEGRISHILFNRTAHYGTKTVIRFNSVKDLKDFIEREFAFQQFDPNCECAVCGDSIWQLLGFTVELPNRRYISFVNNMRGELESAEKQILNKKTQDKFISVFQKQQRLVNIKNNATCFGYIENQGKYVSPCDYISVIKNSYHDELIKLYLKTKGIYGLNRTEIYTNECNDGIIEDKKTWSDDMVYLDECNAIDFQVSHSITDAQSEWEETTTTTTSTTTTSTS